MTCPNPIGVFWTEDGKEVPAPCGKWSCPVCSKVKKNKLLDRVQRGFEQQMLTGHRIRALCLTIGPKGDNAKFTKYFARFRAWLAKPRKHGKKMRAYRNINYFWVKEIQPQTGKLHMHLLIDAFIPWRLIRKAWKWATYGTGENADIRLTDDIHRPGGYMTKYMTKATDPIPGRRFGMSQSRWKQGRRSPFMLSSYGWWTRRLPGNRDAWQLHFGQSTIVHNEIWGDLCASRQTHQDGPGAI